MKQLFGTIPAALGSPLSTRHRRFRCQEATNPNTLTSKSAKLIT